MQPANPAATAKYVHMQRLDLQGELKARLDSWTCGPRLSPVLMSIMTENISPVTFGKPGKNKTNSF